jgi:hypothetical protein
MASDAIPSKWRCYRLLTVWATGMNIGGRQVARLVVADPEI